MPAGIYPRKTAEQRLWDKVHKTETCWLWEGSRTDHGYGVIQVDGRSELVHRFSYQLNIGEIPSDLQIDHLCRIRHCVNPAHLEAVTPRVNQLRGESFSGINARKTHCAQGHLLNEQNIYSRGNGRECRVCRSEASQTRQPSKNIEPIPRNSLTCASCGTAFFRRPSRNRGAVPFCSRTCHSNWMRQHPSP